jgi:2,4-dienoyl-CoA reductase-like NADH-dependent reductase (Old Yellow Enzyme family)
MSTIRFPKVAQLKTPQRLRDHLSSLNTHLPIDDEILTAKNNSPMAQTMPFGRLTVGNRWCIHPMEGWDGNRDGSPSDLTRRRWQRFGMSGAKLIWGGEAVAVQPDGRANPNQLMLNDSTAASIDALRMALIDSHREQCDTTEDLVIGLQLTHSGRFARPNSKQLEPRIAFHHPLLDAKFNIDPGDDSIVWTDSQLSELIDRYVASARRAESLGFNFVDIKACHGYLLHEFLSARSRPGRYGGSLENRCRLMLEIITAVKSECPGLEVGVRLSLFDLPPFEAGQQADQQTGQPVDYSEYLPYSIGFGCNPDNPMQIDLTEPIALIEQLVAVGVASVNLSCGSPYYTPHIQRPASFPPSDGYPPPEDPLLGVARQIHTAGEVKAAFPNLSFVGSGYSYLQDFLPHVAQAAVRAGVIDSVGLGRMVLSYPTLPHDTLTEGKQQRKLICRTFSDCTTAPRHGLVSGCYPLDSDYKSTPEAAELKRIRQQEKS